MFVFVGLIMMNYVVMSSSAAVLLFVIYYVGKRLFSKAAPTSKFHNYTTTNRAIF